MFWAGTLQNACRHFDAFADFWRQFVAKQPHEIAGQTIALQRVIVQNQMNVRYEKFDDILQFVEIDFTDDVVC